MLSPGSDIPNIGGARNDREARATGLWRRWGVLSSALMLLPCLLLQGRVDPETKVAAKADTKRNISVLPAVSTTELPQPTAGHSFEDWFSAANDFAPKSARASADDRPGTVPSGSYKVASLSPELPNNISAVKQAQPGGRGDKLIGCAMTPEHRRRAEALSSVFENGTPILQHGYTEKLGDGRGITAGWAGFTTATGDLFEVVERYAKQVPKTPLAKFLPRLRELAKKGSGSTTGLRGLETEWRTAAKDPKFRAAQHQVVDVEYFQPAMQHADALGIKMPLVCAQLYDAILQHGDGEDPDGLGALIERTNAQVGGSPKNGISEEKWLEAFLKVRRSDLAYSYNPETRKEWAGSVSRVDVFVDLLAAKNLSLKGPICITRGDFKGIVVL
jgi:chitosanase